MLELKNVSRKYVTKGGVVNALDNVSLFLEDKGMVFVLGKSGSGKSTLLNVVGGLDKYDSGEIIIKGKSSSAFKGSDFDSYRNTFIGFIFQEYNILDEFSVARNIGLALELQGRPADSATVNGILETVDMQGLGDRKPNTLSGGQKQRVAIARALVKHPEIIMADEPTGALDSATGKQVFETLQKLSKDKLVIVVSHDRDFAEQYGSRIIELADGKIISDVKKTSSGEFVDSDVLQLTDNAILIKSGTKLEANDLPMLNAFLAGQKSDLFLTTQENAVPKLKDMASSKGGEGTFKNVTDADLTKKTYSEKDFKLIHSKLPIKHAFKMGASGLKVKPIRLAFTILLSAIAFAFFGIADTIGSLNRERAVTDLILNENIENALVTRLNKRYKESDYEERELLRQEDLQTLRTKFPNMNFLPMVEISPYFRLDGQMYHSNTNYYALEATTALFEENNFTLVAGTMPSGANDVAISKSIAQSYIGATLLTNYGNNSITINSVSDFVNFTLETNNGKNFLITGIVDSGDIIEEFAGDASSWNWNKRDKFENYIKSSFVQKIFASTAAMNSLIGGEKRLSNNDIIFITEYQNKESNQFYSANIFYEKESTDVFFDNQKTKLGANEVLVSPSDFSSFIYQATSENLVNKVTLNFENKVERDPSFDQSEFENEYGDNHYELINRIFDYRFGMDTQSGMNIAGFIRTYFDDLFDGIDFTINYKAKQRSYDYETGNELLTQKTNGVFKVVGFTNSNIKMTSQTFESSSTNYGGFEYDGAIGKFDIKHHSTIRHFVAFTYERGADDIRLGLSNGEINSFDSIYFMLKMMAKVFMYIGIGFAVFSALLMLNFIATSISYKKRDIGILRAIGARSNDVFSIFFSESFIISLINSTIAIIFTFVATIIINNLFKTELTINANMLFVTFRQIGLVAAISLGAAFLSSFLPVKKIASKKPIDAIRNK